MPTSLCPCGCGKINVERTQKRHLRNQEQMSTMGSSRRLSQNQGASGGQANRPSRLRGQRLPTPPPPPLPPPSSFLRSYTPPVEEPSPPLEINSANEQTRARRNRVARVNEDAENEREMSVDGQGDGPALDTDTGDPLMLESEEYDAANRHFYENFEQDVANASKFPSSSYHR